MTDFDSFKAEWSGRRIIDPLLIGHGETAATAYQCVSLVKQYWAECYNLVVNYPGDAIDLWEHTNPAILQKFTLVAGAEAVKGDIVVFKANHVGIATGNGDASDVEILEQNGHGEGDGLAGPNGQHRNEIGTRSLPKSHVAGLLRPMAVAPPIPYSIETIDDRNLRINKDTFMYNLGLRDFSAIAANPVGTPPEGYTFVAKAILHHQDGYDYFLPDPANPVGFNAADCDDYDPTPPPPPAPYVPPAAPVPVKRAEKYTLVADVPTYQTYLNALNGASPIGKLAEGSYYIYTTSNDMLNLSDDNMHEGLWVNPKENVAPPLPTPTPEAVGPQVVTPSEPTSYLPSEVPIGTQADTTWKASYKSFHPDGSPDIYELLADYVMSDYSGQRKPIQLSEGKRINVPGTFVKDGVMFYCPRDYKNDVTFSRRYGVPMFDDAGNPMMRKIVEEPLPQHFADLFRLWRNDISNYLGSKPVWDILWHKSKNNKGVKK